MREVRFLTGDDIDAAMPIRSFAFGHPMSQDHREFLERILAYVLGSFEGGRLASLATMWPFTAYVGGTRQGLGGLAAVATAPTERRRGHVAALLRRWFEVLHERGVGLSADSPFDPRFYARYGYQSVSHGHLVKLPVSVLATAEPYEAVEVDPDDHSQVGPIHAQFASRYSLALTRDDGTRGGMNYATQPPGLDERIVTALVGDAYASAWVDRSSEPYLFVRDYAYTSPAGRRRLLAYLASFAGQVDHVLIMLPPGDPLTAMYGDRYLQRMHGLQVRVVDLPATLAGLSAPAEAEFTLSLTDPDCPWQDGVFRLRLGPDGCEATLAPAGTTADVSLGPLGLAAALFGAQDPRSLLATGVAEGDVAALDALAGLLSRHPVYMPRADHF